MQGATSGGTESGRRARSGRLGARAYAVRLATRKRGGARGAAVVVQIAAAGRPPSLSRRRAVDAGCLRAGVREIFPTVRAAAWQRLHRICDERRAQRAHRRFDRPGALGVCEIRSGRKRDALPKLGSGRRPASPGRRKCCNSAVGTCSTTRQAIASGTRSASAWPRQADPLGPFVDFRPEPIVCQTDLGGSIDADAFRDADGNLYLYFKNDGNRVGESTPQSGVSGSAADGVSVVGPASLVHPRRQAWEQKLVEAPTMDRSPRVRAVLLRRFFRLERRPGGSRRTPWDMRAAPGR